MELDLKNYQNRHSLKSKIGRVVWNVVWAIFFRTTPRGNLFRPWRIALLKLFGAKVAWSSNVLPTCKIRQPWNLTMGPYACLSEGVDCYTVAPIAIGDNATVSQGVKLCTASHDISSKIMELTISQSLSARTHGLPDGRLFSPAPRLAKARSLQRVRSLRATSNLGQW